MQHKLPRTVFAHVPNSPHILRLNTGYPPASARRLNQQSVHQNTSHPGPNSTDCLKVCAQISQNARGFELAAGPHPWIDHPSAIFRRPNFGGPLVVFPQALSKRQKFTPHLAATSHPPPPGRMNPRLPTFPLPNRNFAFFAVKASPGNTSDLWS